MLDPTKRSELAAGGIPIFEWADGLNTEQRICNDLPWPQMQRLVDTACDEHSSVSIADAIATALGDGGLQRTSNLATLLHAGVTESDIRAAVGRAAHAGAWFKRIHVAEKLGAIVASDHSHRRQLLLTHTHAGVRAMRSRLARMGCSPDRYRVETISGWALKYATAYPRLSGVPPYQPSGSQWKDIYLGATALLDSRAIRRVVQLSYGGVFVDEYQDCTRTQHALVTRLADLLPCRILGDPLQGIFDFEHDPLDWAADVGGKFDQLPKLQTPYRWRGRNEALGNWLIGARDLLESASSLYLKQMPIGAEWLVCNNANQRQACWATVKSGHTVAAIHEGTLEAPCHALARSLGGQFQCMEAVDCKDLYTWAGKIEQAMGGDRAACLIDFASECLTKVGTELGTIRKRLVRGTGGGRIRKHVDLLRLLEAVAAAASFEPVRAALQAMRRVDGAIMFRRELWESFMRALRERANGSHESLADAAWAVRDRIRRNGRPAERRTVSRTLLVKGLEYDHAIVLDADKLDRKQLYVALTRGSERLTILSRQPVLMPV